MSRFTASRATRDEHSKSQEPANWPLARRRETASRRPGAAALLLLALLVAATQLGAAWARAPEEPPPAAVDELSAARLEAANSTGMRPLQDTGQAREMAAAASQQSEQDCKQQPAPRRPPTERTGKARPQTEREQLSFAVDELLSKNYNSRISTNKTKAELSCDSGEMTLRLNFSEPFKGVVYPDHNWLSPCRFFGDGHLNYELRVPLRGCGTRQASQRVFINDVIVRFHRSLELEEDEVKTLICRYPAPQSHESADSTASSPRAGNGSQPAGAEAQFELLDEDSLAADLPGEQPTSDQRRLQELLERRSQQLAAIETLSERLVVGPSSGRPRGNRHQLLQDGHFREDQQQLANAVKSRLGQLGEQGARPSSPALLELARQRLANQSSSQPADRISERQPFYLANGSLSHANQIKRPDSAAEQPSATNPLERLSSVELLLFTSSLVFLLLLVLAILLGYCCFRRQSARQSSRRTAAILRRAAAGARPFALAPGHALLGGAGPPTAYQRPRASTPLEAAGAGGQKLYRAAQRRAHADAGPILSPSSSSQDSDQSARGHLLAGSSSRGRVAHAGHCNAAYLGSQCHLAGMQAAGCVAGRPRKLRASQRPALGGSRRPDDIYWAAPGRGYLRASRRTGLLACSQRPLPEPAELGRAGKWRSQADLGEDQSRGRSLQRALSNLDQLDYNSHRKLLEAREASRSAAFGACSRASDYKRRQRPASGAGNPARLERADLRARLHENTSSSSGSSELGSVANQNIIYNGSHYRRNLEHMLNRQGKPDRTPGSWKPKIVLKSIEDSYITKFTEIESQEYKKQDSMKPLHLSKWRSMRRDMARNQAQQHKGTGAERRREKFFGDSESQSNTYNGQREEEPDQLEREREEAQVQEQYMSSINTNLRSISELDVLFQQPNLEPPDTETLSRPNKLAGSTGADANLTNPIAGQLDQPSRTTNLISHNNSSMLSLQNLPTASSSATGVKQNLHVSTNLVPEPSDQIRIDVNTHQDANILGGQPKTASSDLVLSPDYDQSIGLQLKRPLSPTSSYNSVSYV